MDNLPRSAWISVWIASLGARGSPSLTAWMVALGSCGSPPFERMDGLPRSLGACVDALGHTDGISLDHRQTARSCGPTCARCCGHMHHRRAQSARATARRRNAKGRRPACVPLSRIHAPANSNSPVQRVFESAGRKLTQVLNSVGSVLVHQEDAPPEGRQQGRSGGALRAGTTGAGGCA